MDLQGFYTKLLLAIADSTFAEGDWTVCDRSGWPDNTTFENVIAWAWKYGTDRALIVVNLSDCQSQALIKVADDTLRGAQWQLKDALSGESYKRSGDEMSSAGLFVDLQPWGFHFLRFSQGAHAATKG